MLASKLLMVFMMERSVFMRCFASKQLTPLVLHDDELPSYDSHVDLFCLRACQSLTQRCDTLDSTCEELDTFHH
jgi:hypothetical protein